MQRASRIAVIGLLALLQLFAPLVHAHAGGEEFSGVIHIPGLEFLSRPIGNAAQPFTRKSGLEVIVGLAPGLKISVDRATQAPDNGLAPPDGIAVRPDFHKGTEHCSEPSAFSTPRLFWLTPASRAPPRLV